MTQKKHEVMEFEKQIQSREMKSNKAISHGDMTRKLEVINLKVKKMIPQLHSV